MEEDRNNEPVERFKNILSADKEDENALPKPLSQTQSPLEQLPRLKPSEQAPPSVDAKEDSPKPKTPTPPANLSNLPQSKQSAQSHNNHYNRRMRRRSTCKRRKTRHAGKSSCAHFGQ